MDAFGIYLNYTLRLFGYEGILASWRDDFMLELDGANNFVILFLLEE